MHRRTDILRVPERFARLLDRSVREGGADLHGERAQRPSVLAKMLQAVIVRGDEIKQRNQVVRSRRINTEMYQVGLEILFDRLLSMEGDGVRFGRVRGQEKSGGA